MYRPRLIPVLLLRNKGLIKTIKFGKSQYLGDPLNAVQIFNKFKTDELVILDIDASKNGTTIPVDLVREIGDEAYMPFAVGGGIDSLEKAEKLINAGAEKVVLNSVVHKNPNVITQIANVFGSQSVIVAVDVKKNMFGKYKAFVKSGSVNTGMNPVEFAKMAEDKGAGEIMLTSISHEGMMEGLNLELIKLIEGEVRIPVIAHGGLNSFKHFKEAIDEGASAVAGGSFFVYSGKQKGILINYPEQIELSSLFNE
jgi:cyclase